MNIKTVTITMRWRSLFRFCGLLPWLSCVAIFALLPLLARAEALTNTLTLTRTPLTLAEGWRSEIGLPFYYAQQKDTEYTWALPPFYSHNCDPGVESHEDDICYPLVSRLQYGKESRWQIIQLFNFSGGREQGDVRKDRYTVFPFYFAQRSPDTNLNYTAVVPFYGHFKDRLFRNEIFFVMFPAYAETRKRDIITHHYPYPLVSTTHGDGLNGWQVFPFAGHEHKEITTVTNGFGDLSPVPGYDKTFYIWPLMLRQNNGIGTDNPERFRASIPLYAYLRSPLRDSTSILWPFFTWIDDRGKNYHEWQGPWPFVIFARGAGKHTSRVWPIYSESSNSNRVSNSYLWPLYVHHGLHADPLDEQRTRVAFYLYTTTVVKNTQTGATKRRLGMWPFFTWQRDFHGSERLQVLALVEPALPENRGVERNWSPLWSLWCAEDNAQTGVSSRSLLWHIWHRETAPGYKNVSLLFGLFQYQLTNGDERTKWFYCPAPSSSTR